MLGETLEPVIHLSGCLPRKAGVSELAARLQGDGAKLKLAVKLRAETTMTLEWIAERLQKGAKT